MCVKKMRKKLYITHERYVCV